MSGYMATYGSKRVHLESAKSNQEALEHFLQFVKENENKSDSFLTTSESFELQFERVANSFSPSESKPARSKRKG